MTRLAAVGRVAAAFLHPDQLLPAAIEFVVADGADGEVHGVQRFNGRLVVHERREQRRRADDIAGSDNERVGIVGDGAFQVRREIRGAARDHVPNPAVPARRCLERPVKIVQRQQLNDHRGLSRWLREQNSGGNQREGSDGGESSQHVRVLGQRRDL